MKCRICNEYFYLSSSWDPDPPETCACNQHRDLGEPVTVKEIVFTIAYWLNAAVFEITYFVLERLREVEL
jgi:hypothetical protein